MLTVFFGSRSAAGHLMRVLLFGAFLVWIFVMADTSIGGTQLVALDASPVAGSAQTSRPMPPQNAFARMMSNRGGAIAAENKRAVENKQRKRKEGGGQQEGGGQDQDQPWAKRAKPITQQRFTVPGNALTFGGKNKFKVDGKKCRGNFQVHSIGDVSRVVTYKEGCDDVVPGRLLRCVAQHRQELFWHAGL